MRPGSIDRNVFTRRDCNQSWSNGFQRGEGIERIPKARRDLILRWESGCRQTAGPPGLETPTSHSGKVRLVAAAACLVVLIGVPWCHENVGSIDLMTGNRACGAAPSEIRVWSGTHHTRRPQETVDLQKWIARHPDRINRQYGAFCDTPLHSAARFGREDLAALLIAAGANVEAPNEHDARPLHTSATYGHPAVAQTAAGPRRRRQRARPGWKDAAARRCIRGRAGVGRRSPHRGREAAPCSRRQRERARTRQRLHATAIRDVRGSRNTAMADAAPLARRGPEWRRIADIRTGLHRPLSSNRPARYSRTVSTWIALMTRCTVSPTCRLRSSTDSVVSTDAMSCGT